MVAFSSNWLIFFPLACCLFIVLRLSQGMRDAHGPSFALFFVRGLIAIMLLFSLLAIGFRASAVSVIWMGILAAFACILMGKNRRMQRTALLLNSMEAATLAQRQTLMGLFVDESQGWVRRRAYLLRRDLAVGLDWARSLESRGIAKGVYERLAVRLQARYGRSSNSTQQLLLQPHRIEAETERLLGRFLLLSWIIIAIPMLVGISTFILPTLREVSEEFGLRPPPMFESIESLAEVAMRPDFSSLSTWISTGFVCIIGLGLLLWFFPTLTQRAPFRFLCRDYHRNVGLMAMALAANQEIEPVAAARSAAVLIPLPFVARRYSRAADLIQQGMSSRQAFLKAGVLRKREMSHAILGFDANHPAWSFQQLASHRVERMLRRYSTIAQIGLVVATLLLATVVGAYAVGTIELLANMISSLG